MPLKESDPGPGAGSAALHACHDLRQGECRRTALYAPSDADLPKPTFTLRAPRSMVFRIMEGQFGLTRDRVTREPKVEGNMAYMMRGIPTVLGFGRCCREVDIPR